jgi:predicted secreted hydrolase
MGISLDNGDRISLWDIIDGDKDHAFATVLHPDGRHEFVDVEPLSEDATSIWTSAAPGHRYPTHWIVSIPMLKARLRVEPWSGSRNLSLRFGVHKYEGASKVAGEMQGEPATGHAVVELVFLSITCYEATVLLVPSLRPMGLRVSGRGRKTRPRQTM